jgi:hypothetical protein
MAKFIPGLELNKDFYFDVVRPLMEKHFPALQYSAGLVGHGSDVLGFDSPPSVDHDWGPHLQIFLTDVDFVNCKAQVDEMLRKRLPTAYKGFPTHFVDGDHYLKHQPKLKKRGPVNHLFGIWTLRSFFRHYLGFDVEKQPTYRDWLLFPQQALVEITGGRMFHDGLDIDPVRRSFAWYPDDIWKYMLRVQWGKISDELQSPARTGEEGDEVGSLIIAARNVQKIMFLCFLMERRYAPYAKWFGTAFERWLRCAPVMHPLLRRILRERNWLKRQTLLAEAYQELGRMHNDLAITPPVPIKMDNFHGRGYPVIRVEEFIGALEHSIRNKRLKNMKYPLGSIDQFIDHARINQMEYIYGDLVDVIQ